MAAPDFKLGQLLALELHRFEEEVRGGCMLLHPCLDNASTCTCQQPAPRAHASSWHKRHLLAGPWHTCEHKACALHARPCIDQVSEIVDRAQKEEKMEAGLAKLDDTWGRVAFSFAPHKEGSDVFLVKMAEEDFEVPGGTGLRHAVAAAVCYTDWSGIWGASGTGTQAQTYTCLYTLLCPWRTNPSKPQMLEDNQVLVQGMMANRYMATFREPVTSWNKKLMAVADVVQVCRSGWW